MGRHVMLQLCVVSLEITCALIQRTRHPLLPVLSIVLGVGRCHACYFGFAHTSRDCTNSFTSVHCRLDRPCVVDLKSLPPTVASAYVVTVLNALESSCAGNIPHNK